MKEIFNCENKTMIDSISAKNKTMIDSICGKKSKNKVVKKTH
jgi:hypothetical protein